MSTTINEEVTPPRPTDGMTDEEFLNYCEAHSDTPRCGFTPGNIHRLLFLAGMKEASRFYENLSPRVSISGGSSRRMADIVSTAEPCAKARRPVSIS